MSATRSREGLFDADFLDVPPEVDSAGARVDVDYWTGAPRWNLPGTLADTCGDWTTADPAANAHIGYSPKTDVGTAAKYLPCDGAYPLLCLQQ